MLQKIILIAAFLVLANTISYACSCAGTGTVQSEFERVPVVMKIRFESPKMLASIDEYIYGMNFVVEKVYKGDMKPGDKGTIANYEKFAVNANGEAEIITNSCSVGFGKGAIGKSLLYFAHKPETGGDWKVWQCTRTTDAGLAHEDLLYLDKLAEVRGKTRVSGKAFYREIPYTGEGSPGFRVLPGKEITITGNGITRTATTDSKGVFEVYGLPPGTYDAMIGEHPGWIALESYPSVDSENGPVKTIRIFPLTNPIRARFYRRRFELMPAGHASMVFEFAPDNAIRGTVKTADGRPLDNVFVKLFKPDGSEFSYRDRYLQTLADGSFSIASVQPGKYILAANPGGYVSATAPFGKIYWPGVADIKDAKLIEIGTSNAVDGLDFHIPEAAELVTVTGRLIYANGSPAVRQWVNFSPQDRDGLALKKIDGGNKALTGADGSFSLRVLRGLSGTAGALGAAEKGKDGCQRISSTIFVHDDMSKDYIRLPRVEIIADKDVPGLEIKMPFSPCEKAK